MIRTKHWKRSGGIYGGKAPALSKRIWNNEALQSGQIEQLIAQAVAKGESPAKLARALEAYVSPKIIQPDNWNDVYDIPFTYKVDYNAKRLAVTSIRHAAWGATITAARDNPFADYFHWELTPAHVIFDICDAHAAHDEGLGEGNFPVDAAPLPHPWCTCLYYIDTDKSLEEIGRELQGWLDGGGNARLDEAFEAWDGRERDMRPAHINFAKPGQIPVIHSPEVTVKPDNDVIARVNETIEIIRVDFPSLPLQSITIGDEPGVAGATADGTGIRLDQTVFRTMASARAKLAEAVASGHTVNVEDPMFMVAHELGHGIHATLAMKRAGLQAYPIGGLPLQKLKNSSLGVVLDVYAQSGAFGSETTLEIYQKILAEMGARALDNGDEMIAQAVAMRYYGVGDHPISDAVARFLRRELEGK